MEDDWQLVEGTQTDLSLDLQKEAESKALEEFIRGQLENREKKDIEQTPTLDEETPQEVDQVQQVEEIEQEEAGQEEVQQEEVQVEQEIAEGAATESKEEEHSCPLLSPDVASEGGSGKSQEIASVEVLQSMKDKEATCDDGGLIVAEQNNDKESVEEKGKEHEQEEEESLKEIQREAQVGSTEGSEELTSVIGEEVQPLPSEEALESNTSDLPSTLESGISPLEEATVAKIESYTDTPAYIDPNFELYVLFGTLASMFIHSIFFSSSRSFEDVAL